MDESDKDRGRVTWYLVQKDYVIEESSDIMDCVEARKSEDASKTRITDRDPSEN